MRMNVGALSALCVAITAAMVAPVSGAETAPGTQGGSTVQAAQELPGASDQTVAKKQTAAKKKKGATGSKNQSRVATLETIVVTATKRSEALQKVPMPVSVLSYHELHRLHLHDFSDYASQVPGLNVFSTQPGLTSLSIRGIASGSDQPSASVGTYVDDTPYGSSSVFAVGSELTPDIDPADLERIEVLRGPQGTLYGAGALGGVVRFITIPPDTKNYAGRLQVGGTSVDGGGAGFGVRGMFNLPLVTDKLAIRANVYDTTTPGFIDDAGLGKTDINESRVKGGRASLLWTPTTTTSLRITALAQNLSSGGGPSESLDPTTAQPLYGDLQQRSAALGGDAFDGHYRLYNVTFNTDFGWATLMSSSSYSTLDASTNADVTSLLYLGPQANGQPYGTLEYSVIPQTKATEEVRLTSPKSQTVEWLGGVFWTRETGNNMQDIYASDYYSATPQPSPFGIPIGGDSQPSTYEAYAAYGSLTWHITDRFDVEAGLRYSHDQQHYTEIGYGLLFGGVPLTVLLDKRSSDSTTTFSLTPKFQINDNVMLYARVASGFLPGGPNVVPVNVPNVPETFSPTKLTDYELGLKATSLDNRLTVDLSAYYIDWTKIPLSTFEDNFTFLSNGGQAKSQGLEATVQLIPVHGLKLWADASLNNPTLTKDNPPPSSGKKGDRLPYAPKYTLGLNGDYDFALGGGWHGYVGASYRYVDKRESNFTVTGTPRSTVPAYRTVDLRAGVNHDLWNIDVYVKNVTNERGFVSGGGTGVGTLNPVTGEMENGATVITPRLFGLSVSRNF